MEVEDHDAADGWAFGVGDPESLREGFYIEKLVARIAAEADGPALGAQFVDSDLAYVALADRQGLTGGLVVNPEAGEAYEIEWPKGYFDDAPQQLAAWSAEAPGRIEPERAAEIMGKNWVFAEEGVDALLVEMGIVPPPKETPDEYDARIAREEFDLVGGGGLGGYQQVLPGMYGGTSIGGRFLLWPSARFVPGRGDGFLGVWDRRAPEEPIQRFPLDALEDALRAHEALMLNEILTEKAVGPVRRWSARWLIVEEAPDPAWMYFGQEGGTYYIYVFSNFRYPEVTPSGSTPFEEQILDFDCRGAFDQPGEAEMRAEDLGAPGPWEWEDVPADVPPNLLATARWVFENR